MAASVDERDARLLPPMTAGAKLEATQLARLDTGYSSSPVAFVGSMIASPFEEIEGRSLLEVIAVASTVEVEDRGCEVCEGSIIRLDTAGGEMIAEYVLTGRRMLDARDESAMTHAADGVDMVVVDLTSEVTGRT